MSDPTALKVLGMLLCSARDNLGLSPERVGAATSIAGNTVRRLERGLVAHPRAVTLERLAEFYGLSAPVLRELASLGDTAGEELVSILRQRAGVEGDGEYLVEEDYSGEALPEELRLALRLSHRPREVDVEPLAAWATARHPELRSEDVEQLGEALENLMALDRVRRRLAVRLIAELHASAVAARRPLGDVAGELARRA